ncbi:MAG: type I secretion system permease/ATPase [Pseudomonadota bacterium]
MDSLKRIRGQFTRIAGILGAFSLVVNVLMLTLPLYMLQIYDRVLPARSGETLFFLTLMALAALAVMGLIEAVRAILASRVAARLETNLGGDALRLCLNHRQPNGTHPNGTHGSDVQPLRDLASLRAFIGSRMVFSVMDLPFTPLFMALLFILHPLLFAITAVGAAGLIVLAWFSQKITAEANSTAQAAQNDALASAETLARNAHTVRAMGMQDNAVALWGAHTANSLNAQGDMERRAAWLSGLSRAIRMGLQVAILGVGAGLVLGGAMTPGAIFAASIISARGLQPLDQVIGNWKQTVQAKAAWDNLQTALMSAPEQAQRTAMDTPKGDIAVEGAAVLGARGLAAAADPILNRILFRLAPGEVLGVVGPSGSGKSTLARLLVGAQKPDAGTVRIDGTEIAHWNPAQLGASLGYLGQEVELLPGTVAQNIARLAPNPNAAMVLDAARRAQVHELIQNLPEGYDTIIGPGGHGLSGGQRQRVALARAFYGNPPIMVLDEPNANLDDDGEIALQKAITEARQAGVTMVIITQRKQVLNVVDRILRLHKGNVDFFGTRQAFVDALQSRRAGQSKTVAANVNPPARRAGDAKKGPRIRIGRPAEDLPVRQSDLTGDAPTPKPADISQRPPARQVVSVTPGLATPEQPKANNSQLPTDKPVTS